MLKHKNKAFTLVELIVVITILAVLGTIAFMSFQGYSASARDSKRISDLSNIRTTLELFGLNTGKFPTPNNPYPVTFSGAELRSQGTFGEQNVKNVEKIGVLPLDPLTEQEYAFSVTHNKKEFELGTILESDDISYNFINKTNAATRKIVRAYIKGNYNGRTLKVSTGGLDYVLAIPSIINGDHTIEDIFDLAAAKKLAYNGYNNLPAGYTGSVFEVNGEDDLALVNPTEIVLFSGDVTDLVDPEDSTARSTLLENIQEAYDGTSIANVGGISEIVNIDFTDTENTGPLIEYLAGLIVNNELGGNLELVPVSIPTSDTEGGETEALVCDDMTVEQVDTLNSAYDESRTKEERCGLDQLSYNSEFTINTIPDEVGYLTNLTEFYIVNMPVTTFPDTFSNLTNLTTLYMENTDITAVPEVIGELINLEILELDANGITELPDNFGNLTKLTMLTLSNNPALGELNTQFIDSEAKTGTIEGITPSGEGVFIESNGSTINITVRPQPDVLCLDMTETNLANLNNAFGGTTGYGDSTKEEWCSLTEINIKGNSVTEIPTEIGYLKNLEILNIDDTNITTLPSNISSLTNLISISLSNNSNLSTLPDELWDLTNLETLYAYRNNLTSVPEEIGELTNLKNLSFYGNYITTKLPSEIGNLTNLERVYLSQNIGFGLLSANFEPDDIISIQGFSSTGDVITIYGDGDSNVVIDVGGSWATKSADQLTCEASALNISTLNTAFEIDYTKVEWCSLTYFTSDINMTSVPSDIGYLTNLLELHLDYNNIETLPDSIGNLVNLTHLYVGGNKLTSLPENIGDLTNLTHLKISQNTTLTALPSRLGELVNLEQLMAMDIPVTQLPNNITNLTKLIQFDFQNGTGLGSFNKSFYYTQDIITSLESEVNITPDGSTIYIYANGTNIVITKTNPI